MGSYFDDLSQKYIQPFLDCVVSDGFDFVRVGSAVNFGVGRGSVTRAVLVHHIDCCSWIDFAGRCNFPAGVCWVEPRKGIWRLSKPLQPKRHWQ